LWEEELSEATQRLHARVWKTWVAFARRKGARIFPPHPVTVSEFLPFYADTTRVRGGRFLAEKPINAVELVFQDVMEYNASEPLIIPFNRTRRALTKRANLERRSIPRRKRKTVLEPATLVAAVSAVARREETHSKLIAAVLALNMATLARFGDLEHLWLPIEINKHTCAMEVFFPFTKTDPLAEGQSQEVPAMDSPICPVRLMARAQLALEQDPLESLAGPLLRKLRWRDREPIGFRRIMRGEEWGDRRTVMDSTNFSNLWAWALRSIGVPQEVADSFTGHCVRGSMATALQEERTPEGTVADLGRWGSRSSLSFYQRTTLRARREALTPIFRGEGGESDTFTRQSGGHPTLPQTRS
jgi:hypothetical protein